MGEQVGICIPFQESCKLVHPFLEDYLAVIIKILNMDVIWPHKILSRRSSYGDILHKCQTVNSNDEKEKQSQCQLIGIGYINSRNPSMKYYAIVKKEETYTYICTYIRVCVYIRMYMFCIIMGKYPHYTK